MSVVEEALLEALNETREMARELALCAGFLLAAADEEGLLWSEEAQGGRDALLGWHRFDMKISDLLERAIECD